MPSKKQGSLVGVIVAIITVVGVGTYSFDFSQTDSHDTTIGDTISTNINDFREGVILDTICLQEPIPEEYITACEGR